MPFMRSIKLTLGLLLVAQSSSPAALGGSDDESRPVLVFAASSLSTVMPELGNKYAQENGGPKPVFTYAASAVLATQINQGAPADLFISANKGWLDALKHRNTPSPQPVAHNRLVVVAGRFSEHPVLATLSELNQFEAIAIADPRVSPLGTYSMQAINMTAEAGGITSKLIPARDARATLLLVEHAATPAAIVYATSAQASKRVRLLYNIDPSMHLPITYMAIPLTLDGDAQSFADFIKGPVAAEIWQQFGFTPETQE